MSSSIRRLTVCVAALSLALGVGACGPSVSQAWTGPGWYLEKSYLTLLAGPAYVGGPFSYEECEEKRIKLAPEVGVLMTCIRENRKPDRYGFY
jgi:hypothetical protein